MTTRSKSPNDLVLYRERMGLSQKQVADLLGLHTTVSLSMIEHGHRSPSLKTALRLAAIYRTPVEYLFSATYLGVRDEIREREQQVSRNFENA